MWYIPQTLLRSHDGRIKRRERFASVERRGIILFLPWVMGYTRRASARRGDPPHKATDKARGHHQHAATWGVWLWQHATFSRNRQRLAVRKHEGG